MTQTLDMTPVGQTNTTQHRRKTNSTKTLHTVHFHNIQMWKRVHCATTKHVLGRPVNVEHASGLLDGFVLAIRLSGKMRLELVLHFVFSQFAKHATFSSCGKLSDTRAHPCWPNAPAVADVVCTPSRRVVCLFLGHQRYAPRNERSGVVLQFWSTRGHWVHSVNTL